MKTKSIKQIIVEISSYLLDQQTRLDGVLNKGLSLEDYDIYLQLKNTIAVALSVMQAMANSDDLEKGNGNLAMSFEGLQQLRKNVQELPEEKAVDKLLGMIGFIAADANLVKEAETIFSTLCNKRKQNEYPLMGLAYVKLMAGQPDQALHLLRDQALALNPDNELAKAFLAIAYTALKEKEEACALTHEIIANNRDQIAMALATEVETFYVPGERR